jgi:hypothetical protein
MKLAKKIFILSTVMVMMNTYSFAAANNPAKEDTTPPAAEGPLAADQIQPITNIGAPVTPPPTTASPSADASTDMNMDAEAETIHE